MLGHPAAYSHTAQKYLVFASVRNAPQAIPLRIGRVDGLAASGFASVRDSDWVICNSNGSGESSGGMIRRRDVLEQPGACRKAFVVADIANKPPGGDVQVVPALQMLVQLALSPYATWQMSQASVRCSLCFLKFAWLESLLLTGSLLKMVKRSGALKPSGLRSLESTCHQLLLSRWSSFRLAL